MRELEKDALMLGYTHHAIGVEAQEMRSLGIYLHWGLTGSFYRKWKTGRWFYIMAKN